MSETIKLFTFSPAFDLPTSGPFGLKLEACLRMAGVAYERVYENDNRKGPKRKSPWIEHGGQKLGDTELILKHLGVDPDEGLTASQRAESHMLRRTLEEHLHAVLEYEMFVNDAGWAHTLKLFAATLPRPLVPIVGYLVRSGFKKHLFERGIARHEPNVVEALGKDDLNALSQILGDRQWLVAERPSKVDASAFGLLALAIESKMPTPVATYARSLPNLVAFVQRAKARFFPEFCAADKQAA